MVSETERMARAGEYVLGRMSARERERAERDLEIDAAFRLAVMTVAERMRDAHGGETGARAVAAEAAWAGLAERLAALPHMQGVELPRSAALPLEGNGKGANPAGRLRAALRRYAAGLRNAFSRRGAAPEGVAVLQTATRETAAVVELRRGARLRLLLLQDFPLRAEEQLSLWGQREDGSYRRLAGFAARAQTTLKSPEMGCTGFALARERRSPAPSMRIALPPLAEGLVRPMAGGDGLLAAGGGTGRAEARSGGRRGNPG